MSAGVTYQYLEPRPRSAYRQLFVKNTRIRAELIYRAHVNVEEPMTVEELATDYALPVAAIAEAIEYAKSNPPEIAADISREDAIMAATGQLDTGYKYHPHAEASYTRRGGAAPLLMLLYLDDDSVRFVLIRRLTAAGHDLLIPAEAGSAGQEDATHLMCAIRTRRALLTHNHDDFELLHDLVLLAGGHHPGILVVRRDNDPTRDMSPSPIVPCHSEPDQFGSLASGLFQYPQPLALRRRRAAHLCSSYHTTRLNLKPMVSRRSSFEQDWMT